MTGAGLRVVVKPRSSAVLLQCAAGRIQSACTDALLSRQSALDMTHHIILQEMRNQQSSSWAFLERMSGMRSCSMLCPWKQQRSTST